MSVRVNLLPGEVAERNRAARQRAGAVAGAVGVVGVLGLIYLWQLNQVSTARDELEAQQTRLAALEGEVAELEEFAQLEQRLEASQLLIAGSLGDEVSLAGVLQDLAAVMPTDAELDNISVAISDEAAVAVAGGVSVPFGQLTMTGRTLRSHAPGLERLLLELDKVASFSNVFFSNSTAAEGGIAAFSVEVDLGPEILTRRYLDGLPEELR